MKGVWSDEEIKALFACVEGFKKIGKPSRDAFDEHAKKYGRQPNSVRNYYYQEIDRLTSDQKRAKKLNIDLSSHQKNQFNFFTEEEKQKIIDKIQEKLKQGYSVRKACLLLSGGDVKQMLRLQNKYRSDITSKKNVLMFQKAKQNHITDDDINGLFLGLVRLIKKNASEQASAAVSKQRQDDMEELRNALTKLGKKERELDFLRNDYLEIKKENALLKKKLLIATCDKARELSKKDKEA